MKEIVQNNYKAEIKWPECGRVELDAGVDFAYILRKDGNFTIDPIAENIAGDYYLNYDKTKSTLSSEYDIFVTKLVDVLKWGYSSKGNIEIHLFDPDVLDKAVRDKAQGSPIISLDPLMSRGVHDLQVSRGYYLSGREDFGQIARPGSKALNEQALSIKKNLNGAIAGVSEDDIFSGGSVIASLKALLNAGIKINRIIPGIQVGKPAKLAKMGVDVDSVVIYELTDGKDIFDKVDLGDPRDYLVGASGLVVKLPNGKYGRAPYILPFVSTTARAGIPQTDEKKFAEKVLMANYEFFYNADCKIGKPILLSQMNRDFMMLMNSMYGFDKDIPMTQIVAWALDNIDLVWEDAQKLGEFQQKLDELELPSNIIFIDVNGTLIADDSTDGKIEPEFLETFKKEVMRLKQNNVKVGICSDSPLPQLIDYSKGLGVDGPIIAENGNIIYYQGKKIVVRTMNVDGVKSMIQENVKGSDYCKKDDCIAPEFGGGLLTNNSNEWAFGANRETSITVFGPVELMEQIAFLMKGIASLTVDLDPSYPNSVVIHDWDYKKSKGNTLSALSTFGHNIIMVGNSMSDWVDPTVKVKCAFVANPRITKDAAKKAAYVSDQPLIEGVIDILKNIK